MRGLAILAVSVALAGCGAPSGSPTTLADGTAARTWGDGDYGLVLVHDADREAANWAPQAEAFAAKGMTVMAVESAEPDAVLAALRELGERVDRVALLGAGTGAGVALDASRLQPDLVDQLIAISAVGSAADLGVFPKLFVASEDEAASADAERMAEEAPGDWNALYLAPGSSSGQALLSDVEAGSSTMDAIILRLEERR
ncbi:MAG TPA: alpha/beta hydrolase [Candidatus Limnocylindria bacterium]|nr:alpha/beta hydrolase [Candidatus Limnocylindria bacterium]